MGEWVRELKESGRKRIDGVSEMMGIRETGGQVTRGKYDKKGDRGVVRDLNTLHLPVWVSRKLPTYPFPYPTFCLK